MPTQFEEEIYNILRKVPSGRVTTYKALAQAIGTKAYRAVGNALNKNPYAPEVPCHRVVCSNGRIGGFAHGFRQKIMLLENEGVHFQNGKVVGFKKVFTMCH